MKALNDRAQHEMQAWARKAIPGRWIMQDVDAYGRADGGLEIPDDETHSIVLSDPKTYLPVCLIETKRSYIDPDDWRPYPADRRNYAAMVALARKVEIPLYVLYHRKGVEILDDSPLGVFLLTDAVPEYHGRRKVMRAADFAASFPYPFGREIAAPIDRA